MKLPKMNVATIMRCVKFATCVVAALAIAGCAKQQANQIAAAAGTAAPGSQHDFVVNIGDRVLFETDSSELTSRAQETLDKQALWLNHYNRYAFTIEGHADERGTREYNIALGARRAQTVREFSSRVASQMSACARSLSGRNGQLRYATTTLAGLRTAGP